MADTDKISSYLGLCRRAGKLAVGMGAVSVLRGGVYLIVADPAASENTKKEILKLQRKFACPLLWIEDVGAKVGKEGRMVAAVREEHLAAAIRKERKE